MIASHKLPFLKKSWSKLTFSRTTPQHPTHAQHVCSEFIALHWSYFYSRLRRPPRRKIGSWYPYFLSFYSLCVDSFRVLPGHSHLSLITLLQGRSPLLSSLRLPPLGSIICFKREMRKCSCWKKNILIVRSLMYVSGRPISFFWYRPIHADKSHFLIGWYQ